MAILGQLINQGQAINDVYNVGKYLLNGGGKSGGGVLGASFTNPNPGGGASAADPKAASFYADTAAQLERQLPGLEGQERVGLGNIQNSYNLQGTRLAEEQAAAQRNYDTQVQTNDRSYGQARSSTMANASQNLNALQRLLNLSGSGSSSAAREAAPYAASLAASQDLSQAQNVYANNASTLDTAWSDTQRTAKNSREDLDRQRYQQENSLRSSIQQAKAGLLDKIAQARVNSRLESGRSYEESVAARSPYQAQIDSLLQSITQLGGQYANPVLQAGNIRYDAPDLNQYTPEGARMAAPTGGAAASVDPSFVGMLAGQSRRDRYGNPI